MDEAIFFDFGKKDVWKVTHDIKLVNSGEQMYHADRPDAQPLAFALFEGGFDLSRYGAVSDWLERVAAVPGYISLNESW